MSPFLPIIIIIENINAFTNVISKASLHKINSSDIIFLNNVIFL